jgi:MFS family permease
MFKNPYFKSALGIYLSYSMLGMILLLLSSHMPFLTKQFHTDPAGISFLISMEGICRSLTLYIAGRLSDKIGRKKFLWLAPIFAILFLVGIPLSPTYQMAMMVSVFAGISHAFMDAASYPSLMECFPKTSGTAIVIVKAFIAMGGIILPLIITFFVNRNMFYGYTFYVIAALGFLVFLLIFNSKFPDSRESKDVERDKVLEGKKFASEPMLMKEGLALIIIGFTSNATFIVFQTWIPTYAQHIFGMSQVVSLKFISYYSTGALVSVGILAALLKKTVKPVLITLIYPLIGITILIILLVFNTPVVGTATFCLLGLSSAGVLQMAQATMGELFWKNKGATIALVSTASGIAAAVIPGLTGLILRYYDILHVFYFMILIYVIGISCAVLTNIRYNKVTKNGQYNVKEQIA